MDRLIAQYPCASPRNTGSAIAIGQTGAHAIAQILVVLRRRIAIDLTATKHRVSVDPIIPHTPDIDAVARVTHQMSILAADHIGGIRHLLGPDHPDVAISLARLGNLYREKGQYGRAEPLFARALAIQEKARGPEDLALLDLLGRRAALRVLWELRGERLTFRALVEGADPGK